MLRIDKKTVKLFFQISLFTLLVDFVLLFFIPPEIVAVIAFFIVTVASLFALYLWNRTLFVLTLFLLLLAVLLWLWGVDLSLVEVYVRYYLGQLGVGV